MHHLRDFVKQPSIEIEGGAAVVRIQRRSRPREFLRRDSRPERESGAIRRPNPAAQKAAGPGGIARVRDPAGDRELRSRDRLNLLMEARARFCEAVRASPLDSAARGRMQEVAA